MPNKTSRVYFIKIGAAVYDSKILKTSIKAIKCKIRLRKAELFQ